MAMNHAEFYDKFGLKMIGAYLQTVAGKPKKIVVDENLYRQQVIDPSWENLPQPMRLMGRNRLRLKILRSILTLVLRARAISCEYSVWRIQPEPRRFKALSMRFEWFPR